MEALIIGGSVLGGFAAAFGIQKAVFHVFFRALDAGRRARS